MYLVVVFVSCGFKFIFFSCDFDGFFKVFSFFGIVLFVDEFFNRKSYY